VCRREGQFGDKLGEVKMGKRMDEWDKRVVERENNELQHRKKRKSESGINRGKKIMMMKLIIQKKSMTKSIMYRNNKCQSFDKIFVFISQMCNPGIVI
jgi:hypothetical protein